MVSPSTGGLKWPSCFWFWTNKFFAYFIFFISVFCFYVFNSELELTSVTEVVLILENWAQAFIFVILFLISVFSFSNTLSVLLFACSYFCEFIDIRINWTVFNFAFSLYDEKFYNTEIIKDNNDVATSYDSYKLEEDDRTTMEHELLESD